MKGIVFREFIAMVETQFSLEMVDAIITESTLQTDGAYTSVGTYPYEEMLELVSHLSTRTAIPVPDLLRAFGRHLFQRFSVIHASYIVNQSSALALLRMLDGHIHVEVRKLYSDAELPSFNCEEQADGSMVLIYRSKRALADFAQGLLEGCIAYFNEPMQIARQDLPDHTGSHTRFTLTKIAHVNLA